ncbi:MAG: hypothetical protein GC136_07205 [Alphaproteobacteria bacterium]|nr:hypothetical protein [Alphaproteobacteria bacterium]
MTVYAKGDFNRLAILAAVADKDRDWAVSKSQRVTMPGLCITFVQSADWAEDEIQRSFLPGYSLEDFDAALTSGTMLDITKPAQQAKLAQALRNLQ